MEKHKILIAWDDYAAKEAKEILETGVKHVSDELLEGVVFEVEHKEPPLGTFGLDSGVLVAIITSSTALVTSIVGLIAQIIASKIANSQAILEIQLRDGTTLKIPASASKDDIEKKLSIVKTLQSVEEIHILTP